MSSHRVHTVSTDTAGAAHGTLGSYVSGFLFSIILTIMAYVLTVRHLDTNHRVPSDTVLLGSLFVLAFVQLCVQLIYFLHLGRESRPRWNMTAFAFMTMVVVIVIAGSLWIMKHLNYSHGVPTGTDSSIIKDEGFSE